MLSIEQGYLLQFLIWNTQGSESILQSINRPYGTDADTIWLSGKKEWPHPPSRWLFAHATVYFWVSNWPALEYSTPRSSAYLSLSLLRRKKSIPTPSWANSDKAGIFSAKTIPNPREAIPMYFFITAFLSIRTLVQPKPHNLMFYPKSFYQKKE